MKPKHDTQWPPPGVRDLRPEPGWLKRQNERERFPTLALALKKAGLQ